MNDQAIIDLYFKRDESAITKTSDKYGAYLWKIAMNILRVKQDSEECVNDTYLSAWNKIPPTRPKNFLPYLGRMTRNISMDKLDYNTASKRDRKKQTPLDELQDCVVSKQAMPEEEVSSKELGECISQFLREFDKEKRVIFIRRYWYSDSIKTIATMLNISESKTKMTLSRMRKKLQEYLVKEGYRI